MARITCRAALAAALPLAIVAVLSACGGGGSTSSTGTGTLSLSITDAPVDNADAVVVEFTGVEIKPAGGSSFSIDFAAPQSIDLLALTGGTAEILLNGEVLDAGDYEWLRLKVNATEGGDPMDDSYIVVGGVAYDLRIPSSDQTGLKLNRPITIPANGSTSFTIDFDLSKSIHVTGQNNYMLRPTLRLVDNSMDGALAGTVDAGTIAAECSSGDIGAVYVFENAGTTPDDINIDGTDVEPVAIATVDWEAGDYSYLVAFLEAGDYTAAFTCDAGDDDPGAEEVTSLVFVGTTDITITAGQTTTQDF